MGMAPRWSQDGPKMAQVASKLSSPLCFVATTLQASKLSLQGNPWCVVAAILQVVSACLLSAVIVIHRHGSLRLRRLLSSTHASDCVTCMYSPYAGLCSRWNLLVCAAVSLPASQPEFRDFAEFHTNGRHSTVATVLRKCLQLSEIL